MSFYININAMEVLSILHQVSDDLYSEEYLIPKEVAVAAMGAHNELLHGSSPRHYIATWRKLLTDEIQSSEYIPGKKIDDLLSKLDKIDYFEL